MIVSGAFCASTQFLRFAGLQLFSSSNLMAESHTTAAGEPEMGAEGQPSTAPASHAPADAGAAHELAHTASEPQHSANTTADTSAHTIAVDTSSTGGVGGADVEQLTAAVERRRRLARYYGAVLLVLIIQVCLYCYGLWLASNYRQADCEKPVGVWYVRVFDAICGGFVSHDLVFGVRRRLYYNGMFGLLLNIPAASVVFLAFCSLT